MSLGGNRDPCPKKWAVVATSTRNCLTTKKEEILLVRGKIQTNKKFLLTLFLFSTSWLPKRVSGSNRFPSFPFFLFFFRASFSLFFVTGVHPIYSFSSSSLLFSIQAPRKKMWENVPLPGNGNQTRSSSSFIRGKNIYIRGKKLRYKQALHLLPVVFTTGLTFRGTAFLRENRAVTRHNKKISYAPMFLERECNQSTPPVWQSVAPFAVVNS